MTPCVKTLLGLGVHNVCRCDNCGYKGQWFNGSMIQGRLQWGDSVYNGRVEERTMKTWI